MISLSKQSSVEQGYPSHIDPDQLAHPGIILSMLMQPEILEIGDEVDSLQAIDELNTMEWAKTGHSVEPLVLSHADGLGRSIFAVYKDWDRAVRREQV